MNLSGIFSRPRTCCEDIKAVVTVDSKRKQQTWSNVNAGIGVTIENHIANACDVSCMQFSADCRLSLNQLKNSEGIIIKASELIITVIDAMKYNNPYKC